MCENEIKVPTLSTIDLGKEQSEASSWRLMDFMSRSLIGLTGRMRKISHLQGISEICNYIGFVKLNGNGPS